MMKNYSKNEKNKIKNISVKKEIKYAIQHTIKRKKCHITEKIILNDLQPVNKIK